MMGFFRDLGKIAGNVLKKLLPFLPILEDKIKVRLNEGDAARVREASAVGHEFCRALDEAFDMIDEAVSPTSPQGDDITIEESAAIAVRFGDAEKRAEALIEKIKKL